MIRRSNSHVWIGLGFVCLAIAVAGAIYLGIKIGSVEQTTLGNNDIQDESAPVIEPVEPVIPTEVSSPAAIFSIGGNWVHAVQDGDDGLTNCGDYSSPYVYKINGGQGEVAQFSSDGRYRAIFDYTTPSGEQHNTQYSANWSQEGERLILENWVAEDAFRNESALETRQLRFEAANVVYVGDRRFVRCVGGTGLE